MIRISYSGDGLERLSHIAATVRNPRGLMAVLGREAGNQLIKHFRLKDQTPNKLGGERQHFWREIAESVNAPVVEGEKRVSVQISDGRFAQKLFGGTIRAFRVANLSIPQTAEAYGRAPSVFEQATGLKLFLVAKKSDNRAVLAVKADNGGITVEYVLTPSVTQEADTTALPDEATMATALVERGEKWLARVEGGATT